MEKYRTKLATVLVLIAGALVLAGCRGYTPPEKAIAKELAEEIGIYPLVLDLN